MPDRKKKDEKEELEWYEYPVAIPAYGVTKGVEALLGRPGTERGPVEGFLPYLATAPWNLAKRGLGAVLGRHVPGLTEVPPEGGTMESLPMRMLIEALNRARWDPTPPAIPEPPVPGLQGYGAPPAGTPTEDIIATFAGGPPALPTPAAQAGQAAPTQAPPVPAGLPPTMDFSQFPGGMPQAAGGTMTFGEGFPGGPETVTVPRGQPPPPVDEEAIIQHIRDNPVRALQQFELGMGQEGMAKSHRDQYRQMFAGILTEAGVDPGAAMMYAKEGWSEKVAAYLSQQAELERRAELGAYSYGAGAGATGLSARRTEASMKRGIAQAKEQGKKVAIIIEPDGSQTVRVLDKPGKGIFEVLYTKKGVLERLRKGEISEKDIAIIDMRPTRTQQPGFPTLPGTQGLPAPPGSPQTKTKKQESEDERIDRLGYEGIQLRGRR